MTGTAVVAPSGPAATEEHTGRATRAPTDALAEHEAPRLTTVPRPGPDSAVVDLGGAQAGGLTARYAEWGVDGGAVLLTGGAPFVDLSGRAGFRADGTLDGTVAMRAAVRLLGLQVAEAEWTVAGWAVETPLAAPGVRLRGSTLAIDLAPIGADVALRPAEGLEATRTDTAATITLPDGALPVGRPLEPRVVELFRGLRGWDVTGLQVHPDAPVEAAPAFVSDTDLFFAPSRYGVDSRETAALLDAAIRAALAGAVGPVGATPPAPTAQPAPDATTPPAADATLVPATVPEAPPLEATREEGGAGPAGSAEAASGAASGAEAALGEAVAEAPVEGAPGEEPPAAEAPAELIMPPAPTEPGPAAQGRMGAVGGGAGGAARAARDLPPAEATVADARGAVTEPVAETAARAREELAAALGERAAPSPEIVELCDRIRTAIREHRPVDEDALLATDPTREAQAAGETVSGSVEGQVDEVEAGYADLNNPPAGTPALTPTPVESPDPSSPGMGVSAASAAPDPIPVENLSLDSDVEATDQRIAGSGIDTRVTAEIPDSPFSTVRDSRGELGEMAEQTPEQLAAQQNAAIETAQADMAALQAQATQALRTARVGTVSATVSGQGETVQSEEQTRESVSQRAQTIFDTAQTQVTTLLEPLTRTAMARWTAGLTRVSQEFHDSLDRVQRWIDDRHSGVGGFFVGLGDAVFGLPDWVIEEYDRAERAFGDGVCDLLLDISSDVNGVVAAAQAIIATARDDIDAAFTAMEEQFPEWAAQERARFSGMLDGLSQRVTETQTSFVRDVSVAATTAVAEAQAAVEERREAARGVIGRIVAAIEAFIDDPVTAIINGLLSLVGIPPAAFWALVARIQEVISDIADDPENFINNLTAGVKQGFQQFFDNFGTHVLRGFWAWLFSGLQTPIPMPTDFSAGSLFTFALQLMGITWPRVREILVRHVGAQNVEIIEAAWQLISLLIERGPAGIVEMIKEQLTPEVIVQTILEAAVEYLVETLIQQVIVRVIGMLNPVGAIAQAIDLIYQVCSWIFRNAARIFRFVEAVVNGMADVIAGNITGLANAVERALAMLIPPVIDFLAGLLHMGGLPNEVADVITQLQARVYQVMDLVIGTLAERGRALLRAVGLGGEEDEEEGGDNDDEELGTTVRFSAEGESHRLWFQVAGDDATLMVASVPESIENTIARWRGKVPDLAQDQQQDATNRLNELESVVTETGTEADSLAAAFAAAAASPDDDVEPPSDAAVESREQAIARMLVELFRIMEVKSPEEYLADIAAHLPRHGARYAGTVRDQWIPAIRRARRVPAGGSGGSQLWPDTVLSGTATAAMDLLAAESTHQLLLPWFLVGSQSNQREAASGTFANQAFETDSPDPAHTVRQQFVDALGQAAAQALKTSGLAEVTEEDNAELRSVIGRIGFSMSGGRWGSFDPWPQDEVNPLVRQAVTDADGVLEFLRSMVRSRSAGGMSWAEFTPVWESSTATRTWVKNRFRAVEVHSHEWIPTSELRRVVDHSIEQASLYPDDVSRSLGWINFFSALRSGTEDVSYYIRSSPEVPPEEVGTATPLTEAGVGSHVGGASADARGRQSRGTIGQKAFHDWLRVVFDHQRDNGPVAFGQSLISSLGYEIWDGSLDESMAPRAVWFQPIELYFTVDGGAGRVYGLTLAQLAIRQREAWQRIQSDFTRALYSVDAV